MMMYCPDCKQPVNVESDAEQLCPFCNAPLVPRKVFAPGDSIAGFSIIRELGHGGMGVVYLAEQVNLNRYVALKVLEDTLASDEEFVKSFFREAGAAAKMAHPNIVQAYDAGIDKGVCYFVMELIQGQNLDDFVVQNGPMSVPLLLNVAVYIADALTYAWEKNHLCHGDIKPENIILQDNGEIKLADLGLARDHSIDVMAQGEIMATPAYAPPEVIRGEIDRIGFKSDMYSFGSTLYHLAVGEPPFPGEDPKIVCAQQLNNQPKPLIAIDCNIPEELSVLVDQLMEKSPDHRPYSWAFVTQKLMMIRRTENQNRAARELQDRKFAAEVETTPLRNNKKYSWIIAALVLIVTSLGASLAGLNIYYANQEKREQNKKAQLRIKYNWNNWLAFKNHIAKLSNREAARQIEWYMRSYSDVPPEAGSLMTYHRKLAGLNDKINAFRKNKTAVMKACARFEKSKQKIHPVFYKQIIFDIACLRQQYKHVMRFRSLLELENYDAPQPVLTPDENAYLQRCAVNFAQSVKKYNSAPSPFSRQQQQNFAIKEAQFLCRCLKYIFSASDMTSFIRDLQDFKKHRFKFLPQTWKNTIRNIESIAKDQFFVSNSQYLINMKKFLIGKNISSDWKIVNVTENGFLCRSGKNKISRTLSWREIFDLWNEPADILMPDLKRMSKKDALQFYARTLLLRKQPAYYNNIINNMPGVSPAERKQLQQLAQLFCAK